MSKPPAKKPRKAYARHEATAESRRRIELMCSMGVSQRDIAMLENLTVPTLRSHYKAELARGEVKANFAVTHALFKAATRAEKPNVDAQKFWLKSRAGWNDAGDKALGKKEQADADARNATEGTHWAGLLN